MKTILLLGGARAQLSAIETAKRLGHRVIVLDQEADCPGRALADGFYQVSTTDTEAVVALAKTLSIDGVLCYAADSGAATAAYVAQVLQLAGNPVEAVACLTNKEQFRAFQQRAGFHVPVAKGYRRLADVELTQFTLPVMVKPVDAAGSKGVSKVTEASELAHAVANALKHSRSGRFIVEEYIESAYPHIGGDAFSVDGQLVFTSLSNEYFSVDCPNPFMSVLATWPSLLPEALQQKVRDVLQAYVTKLGMRTSAYNFDIRIGLDGHVYVIELTPRNGGAKNPEVIHMVSGVDLIKCVVQAAVGEPVVIEEKPSPFYWASYVLHSASDGLFEGFNVSPSFWQEHVALWDCSAQRGMPVSALALPTDQLGVCLLRFQQQEQLASQLPRIRLREVVARD